MLVLNSLQISGRWMVFKEFIPFVLKVCVIVRHKQTILFEATYVFIEFVHSGDIILRFVGYGKWWWREDEGGGGRRMKREIRFLICSNTKLETK